MTTVSETVLELSALGFSTHLLGPVQITADMTLGRDEVRVRAILSLPGLRDRCNESKTRGPQFHVPRVSIGLVILLERRGPRRFGNITNLVQAIYLVLTGQELVPR